MKKCWHGLKSERYAQRNANAIPENRSFDWSSWKSLCSSEVSERLWPRRKIIVPLFAFRLITVSDGSFMSRFGEFVGELRGFFGRLARDAAVGKPHPPKTKVTEKRKIICTIIVVTVVLWKAFENDQKD